MHSDTAKFHDSFHMLDWDREVVQHPAYAAALENVVNFYRQNEQFRADAVIITARVLGKTTAESTGKGPIVSRPWEVG